MATAQGPVLVIGATGQQGRATIGHLLQRGWEVRAFVRDLDSPAATKLRDAGANLIEGNLDEPASVRAAMTDAYGVFMMLTPMSGVHITTEGIAAEIRWGTTVVDLAAELNIAHLVYSSVRGAGQNAGVDYYAAKEAVEARIHQTGIPGDDPAAGVLHGQPASLQPSGARRQRRTGREPRGAQRHLGLDGLDGRHRRVRGHRLRPACGLHRADRRARG
jgi:uncharacterized protein YbjT (DUF2867 family)